MKKVVFLFAIALAFSCSNDDSPAGGGCSSQLTSLNLEGGTVYTGEILSFPKPAPCISQNLKVLVNGKEVALTVVDSEVSFTVPPIAESTATFTIQGGGSEVYAGPVSVVKAYGTWKAVAPFPADGRGRMVGFGTSTDGYLFGGAAYLGTGFQSYDELYKYNAADNAWTLANSAPAFSKTNEALVGNDVFLDGAKYSIADNTLSPLSFLPYLGEGSTYWDTHLFSNQGNVYAISDINQNLIMIHHYDPVEKAWSIVKQLTYLDNGQPNYFQFDFAIEQNGMTYIGILQLNRNTTEVWAFDGTANTFTKVTSVSTEMDGSTQSLKHLFTLNKLAYFMEEGESSQDLNGKVDIIHAHEYFFVYNFETNAWRKIKTEWPQSMHGASSFNIGNRGFAGLGAREGTTTGFIYQRPFFEFVPEP
ncbi:Kelch repeat-containing protein [Chryseolinea serpens]|nr:kelch repeat-containing protein [Chryseolinea serpens]